MCKPASTLILAAATFILPAESAVSAVCNKAALDGPRTLESVCDGGACAKYQVGAAGVTNLGFGGTAPDIISFEFWSSDDTPLDTGTFDLGSGGNANYSSCRECILVFQDILNGVAQKIFFQTAGSITIDENTVPGAGPDVGLTWSNVTLAEVTLNPDTAESTLVPNGDCYAIVSDPIFVNGFES